MGEAERSERAMSLFSQGYSCSQSVVLAFSDLLDIDEKTLTKLASSFGGGMGGLREVCGCVSGMAMVVGLLFGYDDPKARGEKKEHYALVRSLAGEFSEKAGSIICRDLLSGNNVKVVSESSERTAEYYKKRPCREMTGIAAGILWRCISEKTKEKE